MKKIILSLTLSAMIVLTCFDYSSALTFKKKSLRKTVEELQLQVTGDAEKSAKTDATLANLGADMDIVRQDLGALSGKLEEKAFDIEQMRETVELLSETIQTLEKRIKLLETPYKEALQKEAENTLKRAEESKIQTELIAEINTALTALTARVDAIDGIYEDKASEAKEGADPKSEYMKGLDLIRKKKDYTKALVVFKNFLLKNPQHELADNAHYWIGEIYYVRGEYEKAILEFNKVIKGYKNGDKVAAAILKQSYSFEKLGSKKEAGMLLKKIIKKYPDSPEAKIAKKHLKKAAKEAKKEKKKKEKNKTKKIDKKRPEPEKAAPKKSSNNKISKPVNATPEKALTPEKSLESNKALKSEKAAKPEKALTPEKAAKPEKALPPR